MEGIPVFQKGKNFLSACLAEDGITFRTPPANRLWIHQVCSWQQCDLKQIFEEGKYRAYEHVNIVIVEVKIRDARMN